MFFNSTEFLAFFGLLLTLYILVPQRFRWVLLLVASYIFYGSWNAWYLSLILFSTAVNYAVAVALDNDNWQRRRNLLLWTCVVANLGLLFVFKYYDFFLSSFVDLLDLLGIPFSYLVLRILLPVGISFYTFQTIGYTSTYIRVGSRRNGTWVCSHCT